MNHAIRKKTVAGASLALLTSSVFLAQLATSFAQITAFTYQGRLNDGAGPANGVYDFQFRLYDAPSGGGQVPVVPISPNVTVSNGLFTTAMDFGTNVFNGSVYWLEIAVQPHNGVTFTTLNPRQAILPVPGAIFATSASNLLGTVAATQLSGTVAVSSLPPNPNFPGTVSATAFSGTGTNLTSLNADNISSGALADARLSTNVALRAGGNTFTEPQIYNGPIYLNTTDGFDQSAVGNFLVDAAYLPGGRFAVLTNGNVGINNPDPQYTLDVNGPMNLPLPATIYSGGASLLRADTSGNFFDGFAGNLTLTGSYNIGIGNYTLLNDTSGSANTAIGLNALFYNTSGFFNTACGFQALVYNTTGSNNVASGHQALYSATIGIFNTADGFQALYSDTNGSYNTALGCQTLYSNRLGGANTAIGADALYSNVTGAGNTAAGANTLYNNTTGEENTAAGDAALNYNTQGGYNTAVGSSALSYNTNGGYNVAVGAAALGFSRSGSSNVAVGENALEFNSTGDQNIALGEQAGYYINGGSSNIDIGSPGVPGDANMIRIGTGQAATFIAGIYNTTVSGGAPVYINSFGQLGTISSSQRFKQNIQSMGDASDVLLSLQPVTFQYKPDIDPQGLAQFGLIAEQVEKVDPDLVVHDPEHGIYTVRYEAVNAMLLNEFLKQHRTVEEQKTEIQQLLQNVAELKTRDSDAAELRQENQALERRLSALEQLIQKK